MKDKGKGGKAVLSDSNLTTTASEDSSHKLLATSALRRQVKINGQIGEANQKDKISLSLPTRQIQIGLFRNC